MKKTLARSSPIIQWDLQPSESFYFVVKIYHFQATEFDYSNLDRLEIDCSRIRWWFSLFLSSNKEIEGNIYK